MYKVIPVLVILIAVLFISGCVTQQQEQEGPAATEPAEVGEVGSGISDLDNLNQELNISDLESLDSDLGDITW